MSIDENCDNDRIDFYDSFNISTASYCGKQSAVLAIESCTSQLNITLRTQSNIDPALRGALIYYEAIPQPANLIQNCFFQTTTTRSTTTTRTTTSTTPTTQSTRPANYGLALNYPPLVTCSSTSISCPKDYVIILLSSEYATNDATSASCSYTPTDCFETTGSFNLGCSGKQSCNILYSNRQLSSCNKRQSKYLYITYQCVPVENAGKPNPNPVLDVCTSGGPDNKITVDSSVIIRSPNFPTYPPTDQKCKKEVVAPAGKALKVYLVIAGFKASTSVTCVGSNDYVKVCDCAQCSPTQCGNTLYGKLLLESISNNVTIDFAATGSPPNVLLKGFQMYIEVINTSATCGGATDAPSLTTTPPNTYIGLLGPVKHIEICALKEKTITCPDDYYVLVDEEEFVNTGGKGCNHSDTECRQPTDLAYQKCSSQQECTIYAPNTPLNNCGPDKRADFLDIEYRCLPASLSSIKTFGCNDRTIDADNGFIISPSYPVYSTGIDCNIRINAKAGFGIQVFIVDLLLGDQNENGTCTDYLILNNDTAICSLDQPRLAHISRGPLINLQYKSLSQGSSIDSLRGFKLYFETYSVAPTTAPTLPPTSRRPVTTRLIQRTTIVNVHHNGSLTGWSLGLGIPALIAVIVIALWMFKRSNSGGGYSNLADSSSNTRVNFSKKNNSDFDDVKSFSNQNFNAENAINANLD